MSSRCRFCGGKILSDATTCEHCGKQLRKPVKLEDEPLSVSNIESWKGKTIPPWLMYLVVGIFLACFVIMFLDAGYDPEPAKPPSTSSQTSQPAEPNPPEIQPAEQAR